MLGGFLQTHISGKRLNKIFSNMITQNPLLPKKGKNRYYRPVPYLLSKIIAVQEYLGY